MLGQMAEERVRSRLPAVGYSKLYWEPAWGFYLVVRERPTLENRVSSPLELQERGSGSAVGMGEQASAMI
jgi:hypothetical protein